MAEQPTGQKKGNQCESCNARRSRLKSCATCGKRLCGCCGFKSRGGFVCPGACHEAALRALANRIEKLADAMLKAHGVTP